MATGSSSLVRGIRSWTGDVTGKSDCSESAYVSTLTAVDLRKRRWKMDTSRRYVFLQLHQRVGLYTPQTSRKMLLLGIMGYAVLVRAGSRLLVGHRPGAPHLAATRAAAAEKRSKRI